MGLFDRFRDTPRRPNLSPRYQVASSADDVWRAWCADLAADAAWRAWVA